MYLPTANHKILERWVVIVQLSKAH